MSQSTEIVCEENFYNHLTLGLQKTLRENAGVQDIKLERKEPCEKAAINAWEQRHSSILPCDLKNFYLSTDGFNLNWSYSLGGETIPIGNLNINPLSKLTRIAGLGSASLDNDGFPSLLDLDLLVSNTETPLFKASSKIFVLDSCKEAATVCLAYVEHKINPSIWLLDRSLEWHFLASTFTQYFRMMLVYHGLPEWQLHLTPIGLSPWAEQLMHSVLPHLNDLQSNEKQLSHIEASLDPSIFKMKSKHNKKIKHVGESHVHGESLKGNSKR